MSIWVRRPIRSHGTVSHGQIAALSETFATLATEYAQVYTDVSTSPCLKK